MNDRPILFSAPMVRALLDGRKTQTRRLIERPPEGRDLSGITWRFTSGYKTTPANPPWMEAVRPTGYGATEIVVAPRRVPARVGDRLWVRETWRATAKYDIWQPGVIPCNAPISYDADYDHEPNDGCRGKTRVSIHMPRWASRLTLTVTDVRVQRLWEIGEDDARAEGCPGRLGPNPDFPDEWDPSPTEEFRDLWNTINGEGSWDANPWVVALTFTVARANIDAPETEGTGG